MRLGLLLMSLNVETRSDGIGAASLRRVGEIRFGPARVPSQESPEAAIAALQERGYTACEIDFEGRFWMDYDFAARFGELARDAGIVLSVHAPIAGFMGHAERGKKLNMAVGMLDHSAGIAKAAGAEVVVFHPGFLLGRTREEAIDSVVEQLGELRARLEKKDRAVPFGIEVMGRVRELGSCRRRDRDLTPLRLGAAGARLRAHARDVGRRASPPRAVRRGAREGRRRARGRARRSTSTSRTSSSRTATRRSTCATARARLRAEPLRDALAQFERPATVISESPDEESSQAIKAVLGA